MYRNDVVYVRGPLNEALLLALYAKRVRGQVRESVSLPFAVVPSAVATGPVLCDHWLVVRAEAVDDQVRAAGVRTLMAGARWHDASVSAKVWFQRKYRLSAKLRFQRSFPLSAKYILICEIAWP
jgi:hypothetical protein